MRKSKWFSGVYNHGMTTVTKDPQVMHGTPCFAGTRVPVKSLFDHLQAGYNVEYFLAQFPTVERTQVLAVLHEAESLVERHAGRIGSGG